jgi:hypothetical protein
MTSNLQLQRETSAYKAQYPLDPSSRGSIYSITQIYYRFIGTITGSDGKPIYDYTNMNWNIEPDYIKALYP